MAHAWTQDQDAKLLRHETWSDEDLALAVSLIGPARSIKAVLERRRTLNSLWRISGGRDPDASRQRNVDRLAGWPIMRGSDEERDTLYAEMILDAQSANRSQRNACQCPRCRICYDWALALECKR